MSCARAGRRRVGALGLGLATAAVLLALAPAPRAAREDEARLRRRVQRFYVLSYLNRHGEMWEMFSADLRVRLGDDRTAYVSEARLSGFELFSSRIEELELRGDTAVVDVAIQAQVPGTASVATRHHRMLWRLEDDDWRYGGSLDVTHADLLADPAGGALGPPSDAPPPAGGAELLPGRVPLRRAPAVPAAPASPAADALSGGDAGEVGVSPPVERWDLVAIPPPGVAPPEDAAVAPAAPAEVVAAEATAAAPARKAPSRVASRELPLRSPPDSPLLPPERVHEAPSPAGAAADEPVGRASGSDAGAAHAGDTALVRQAAQGSPLRRHRALQQMPPVPDAAAAALMIELLPEAPEEIAAAFLERLARRGGEDALAAARDRLAEGPPRVRIAALAALGSLGRRGDGEDVPAVVAVLEAERRADLRAAAARALGRLGGAAAGDRLAGLLADAKEEPRVREAAAWAAGACGCLPDRAALRALAQDPGAGAAGLAAVDALGRLATPDARQALAAIADRPGEAPGPAGPVTWRLAVLRALARAGEEDAGRRLASELLDRGERASSADVELVAEAGDTAALRALLAHPHPAVRARAGELLSSAVESDEAGVLAWAAVDAALVVERDPSAFRALVQSRDALASFRRNESTVSP